MKTKLVKVNELEVGMKVVFLDKFISEIIRIDEANTLRTLTYKDGTKERFKRVLKNKGEQTISVLDEEQETHDKDFYNQRNNTYRIMNRR